MDGEDKVTASNRKISFLGLVIVLMIAVCSVLDILSGDGAAFYPGMAILFSVMAAMYIVLWQLFTRRSVERMEKRISDLAEENRELSKKNKELGHVIGKLEEVEKIKKNFLLMASHQMRSPLVAIQSVMKVILSGVTDDREKMDKLLGQAYSRSEDMLGMVNDILDLAKAKVETEEGEEEADPRKEAEFIISLLSQTAHEKGVEVRLEVEDDLPAIKISRKSLDDVINNLVDNAIIYSKENSEVKVRLGREGDSLLLVVQDSGIGIPEEDRDKIFKEFYRSDNAKMLKTHGTGLGLPIVYNIVTRFGGNIDLESKVDEGTCFRVKLPFEPVTES
ncbi:MAG TPA: HAMP domain-containing sensor histidine kinase [bacterium]|nr:HAMP domain-containing sensor histidine kinase [bacterium]